MDFFIVSAVHRAFKSDIAHEAIQSDWLVATQLMYVHVFTRAQNNAGKRLLQLVFLITSSVQI